MLRAIREIKPKWVVGENVRGLVSWNGGLVFDEVQSDLEAEGYRVLPVLLPACSVNAPHRRDRIWFIAYTSSVRCVDGGGGRLEKRYLQDNEGFTKENQQERKGWKPGFSKTSEVMPSDILTNTTSNGRNENNRIGKPRLSYKKSEVNDWNTFPVESPVCSGDDGLPYGLDAKAFSWWRNKSLHGAGNAIVPQVAYEIFRTIELYDLLY
jgi:DNA (cytosine-5)-methyltransferase 1